MGKYEASTEKKNQPGKKAASNTPVNKKKNKGRIALIIVLSVITLIAVVAIWLVQPPQVPDYTGPSQATTPGTIETPTDSTPASTAPKDDEEEKPVTQRKKDFYTFLVLGTNDNHNTDVIMLASLDLSDSKNPDIHVINIPRDSMVDYPSPIKRINGVYGYYGSGDEGMEAVRDQVEIITGVRADFYCLINLTAFLKIVDVVDGVDFYVPYNMYHADKDASQTINLRKGQQVLNSKKALQLIRYRGTAGGDLDRINMQKDFILALLRTVKANFSIGKIPDMLDAVFGSIRTDMNLQEMLWFATNGLYPADVENDITFHTMPISHMGKYRSGDYGNQDYIYLDKEGILELVNETVNPLTTDIEASSITITILEN